MRACKGAGGWCCRPGPLYTLLHLGGSAGGLELLDHSFGVGLGDALLDVSGSGLDQVLGLLKAQGGYLADGFDDVDLVGADVLEDHGPLGLLLLGGRRLGGGRGRGGGGGPRDGGGGGGGGSPPGARVG